MLLQVSIYIRTGHLVEDWIANPAANYGFILDMTGGNTSVTRPSEYSVEHMRPMLTIKAVRYPPGGALISVL